jgi:hypothetical protein
MWLPSFAGGSPLGADTSKPRDHRAVQGIDPADRQTPSQVSSQVIALRSPATSVTKIRNAIAIRTFVHTTKGVDNVRL